MRCNQLAPVSPYQDSRAVPKAEHGQSGGSGGSRSRGVVKLVTITEIPHSCSAGSSGRGYTYSFLSVVNSEIGFGRVKTF